MRDTFSRTLDKKGPEVRENRGGCTTACLKAAGTQPERRPVFISDRIHELTDGGPPRVGAD